MKCEQMQIWRRITQPAEQKTTFPTSLVFDFSSRLVFNQKIIFLKQNIYYSKGGAVAEWSKALPSEEKINKNKKDPGFAPGLGKLK